MNAKTMKQFEDSIQANTVLHTQARQILNERNALLNVARECVISGECYCPENVAYKGPCGYCMAKAAISFTEKE